VINKKIVFDIFYIDVYNIDVNITYLTTRGYHMEQQSKTISANFPNIKEFAKKYPQYGPFAKDRGNFIFNKIMTLNNFIRAVVCTELGLPAVTGIADSCYSTVKNQDEIEWKGYVRQFIGAVVCALMEANNYEKTGKKRSVLHHAFTKGEVYRLKAKGGVPWQF
jgi:hypothetical protein